MNHIDYLLNTPYWIIDILPMQVPKDSPGQYFTVEEYFLKTQLAGIKQKHVNIILKLNCYMDISMEGEVNPSPGRIQSIMQERYVYIMIGDSMVLSEPDDTHLTLFNPDEKLLNLIKLISSGEGLFVWKPEVCISRADSRTNRDFSSRVINRSTDMFHEELKQIIRLVLQQGLSGQALMDALTADVNPTEIYASDDMLAMDSYFSLLHYATGEEVVADAEWKYFLDCLNGNRVYSLDEKLQMTDKNSVGGSV